MVRGEREVFEVNLDDNNIGAVWAHAQWFTIKSPRLSNRVLNTVLGALALPLAIIEFFLAGLIIVSTFVFKTSLQSFSFRPPNNSVVSVFSECMRTLHQAMRFSPTRPLRKVISWLRSVILREDRMSILYLRSFKMDGRLDIEWSAAMKGHRPSLESLLTLHFQALGPVRALGEPVTQTTSAQRITVPPDAWHEPVVKHMRLSRFIAIVPEFTSGTLWELETILQSTDLLSKTIFLNVQTVGRQHSAIGERKADYGVDQDRTFFGVCVRLVGEQEAQKIDLARTHCAFVLENHLFVLSTTVYTDSNGWAKSAKFAAYLLDRRLLPADVMQLKRQDYVSPWKKPRTD